MSAHTSTTVKSYLSSKTSRFYVRLAQATHNVLSRMRDSLRPKPGGRCTLCRKQAKMCCDDCASTYKYLQPRSINYCTEECRANDSATHEKLCKSRQDIDKLARVATILQSFFFILRKNTFDRNVTYVKNQHNKCAIFVGPEDPSVTFYSIPLPVLRNEQLKAVALSYFTCGWSVGFMWDMLLLLVKGLDATVMEASGRPAWCLREAYLKGDGQDWPTSGTLSSEHVCFFVSLKDRKKFALDLTGAQYGIHDTLMPWKEYTALLGFQHRTFRPGGSEKKLYEGMKDATSDKFALKVSRYLSERIQGCMDSQEDWLSAVEGSIGRLMEDAIAEAFRLDGTLLREGGQAYRRDVQEEQEE